VAGDKPMWFTHPQTVTHPSTSLAWHSNFVDRDQRATTKPSRHTHMHTDQHTQSVATTDTSMPHILLISLPEVSVRFLSSLATSVAAAAGALGLSKVSAGCH